MPNRNLLRALGATLLAAAATAAAFAFNLSGQRWPADATVTMHLQLGPANGTLLDGATSWGEVAEAALSEWNAVFLPAKKIQFAVVRNSPAPGGIGNGVNNVFWSQSVYGEAWDGRTLAITLSRYDPQSARYSETDVLFNNTLPWNSYRGALRTAPAGGTLNEFRRVALHEFGHALGLNHPDDIGQSVTAIMNAATSSVDALTADDIAGGRAIYDNPNTVPVPLVRIGAGALGWTATGTTLTLQVGTVENVGDATSGTLHLELWGMPQHYANGLPSGSRLLGSYTFPAPSTLAPRTSFKNVNVNTAFVRPPNGSYYVAMVLTEFTGGSGSGYTIRDFVEFNDPLNIGSPARPEITAQPVAVSVPLGGGATFTVGASGTLPLAYQWRKNGTPITGATAPTFTVSNATAADGGTYSAVITNGLGSITSGDAALTVLLPGNANDPGRIINLSILTDIARAGDEFTMGFVVGGAGTSGEKPLVIRAAGPSLGALGVPGTLDDPQLELYAGPTKTGGNNDWGGGADLAAALSAVGAFAYSGPTSKDAALTARIATRDNSVKVSANGSGTGTVIAEVYDATPGSGFTATTPRLLNVSVNKNIGTKLTAGFVIGGSSSKTVLIRAIGPGLAALGVPASIVVPDPQLVLFGGGGVKAGENNDWGGTPTLKAAATSVGAFSIPETSKDAALLITLNPGSYSVEVTGAGGASGIAVIEVYDVPQ